MSAPLQAAVMKSAVRTQASTCAASVKTRVGIQPSTSAALPATIEAVWRAFGFAAQMRKFEGAIIASHDIAARSAYLTHPIFPHDRAETEMIALLASFGRS